MLIFKRSFGGRPTVSEDYSDDRRSDLPTQSILELLPSDTPNPEVGPERPDGYTDEADVSWRGDWIYNRAAIEGGYGTAGGGDVYMGFGSRILDEHWLLTNWRRPGEKNTV